MRLFDSVPFNASDVRAVAAGTSNRVQLMAVLTSQTCGEACWHAREDVCRCSCGGRNHGCLLNVGAARPERTCKIDGVRYKLAGVGNYRDLIGDARAMNRAAGWRSVETPTIVIDGIGQGFTPADAATARAEGRKVEFVQYRYSWSETDAGAPARLKSASASQRNWTELAGWKESAGVYLLWQRCEMPARPTQKIVDRLTGEPAENQDPT
jgi:hypothetical protein